MGSIRSIALESMKKTASFEQGKHQLEFPAFFGAVSSAAFYQSNFNMTRRVLELSPSETVREEKGNGDESAGIIQEEREDDIELDLAALNAVKNSKKQEQAYSSVANISKSSSAS